MCFNNTFWQCLRIHCKTVVHGRDFNLACFILFHGVVCTVMAVFILTVLAPRASANIWCPKQMPKTGKSVVSKMVLIIGTAYSPVAAGSPGPFDRKTPSGLWANTSSAVAVAGNTVTSHPADAKQRKIVRLHRNLMQQLYVLDLFAAYIHLATPNAFHSNDNFARMSRPWQVKPLKAAK